MHELKNRLYEYKLGQRFDLIIKMHYKLTSLVILKKNY